MGHPIVRPGRFIFKYLRGIPLIKNENKKEFPQMRGEKRPAREQRQGFFAARGKWRNEWKIIKKHPGRHGNYGFSLQLLFYRGNRLINL